MKYSVSVVKGTIKLILIDSDYLLSLTCFILLYRRYAEEVRVMHRTIHAVIMGKVPTANFVYIILIGKIRDEICKKLIPKKTARTENVEKINDRKYETLASMRDPSSNIISMIEEIIISFGIFMSIFGIYMSKSGGSPMIKRLKNSLDSCIIVLRAEALVFIANLVKVAEIYTVAVIDNAIKYIVNG